MKLFNEFREMFARPLEKKVVMQLLNGFIAISMFISKSTEIWPVFESKV